MQKGVKHVSSLLTLTTSPHNTITSQIIFSIHIKGKVCRTDAALANLAKKSKEKQNSRLTLVGGLVGGSRMNAAAQ